MNQEAKMTSQEGHIKDFKAYRDTYSKVFPGELKRLLKRNEKHFNDLKKQRQVPEECCFDIFTCHNCPNAVECIYSFDLYNTDFDCLGSK